MLLRFIAPGDLHGALNLQISSLTALPVLRVDGIQPVAGDIVAGRIVEVINAVDRWILLGPDGKGCPPGSFPVHDGLCMDITSSANMFIYAAMDHCQARGGKLCTWDEYYLGCTVLGTELQELFTAWEWLDDTSNHTHTADQGGRYTCKSQRSSNPVLIQGKARCCYHPR